MSAPFDLPLVTAPARPVATISPERYGRLAQRVRLLSWLSLGAMSLEGFVAVLAGILAGSVALVGFGLRIAEEIGSAATKGEGRQNILCAYLAGALLVGLLGNAIAGAWWLDPLVGLLIAAVAVREGVDAWRGEGCCVGSPLDGYANDCCGSTNG